jgi:hypothetical protein
MRFRVGKPVGCDLSVQSIASVLAGTWPRLSPGSKCLDLVFQQPSDPHIMRRMITVSSSPGKIIK